MTVAYLLSFACDRKAVRTSFGELLYRGLSIVE